MQPCVVRHALADMLQLRAVAKEGKEEKSKSSQQLGGLASSSQPMIALHWRRPFG
jgi:hypothetical protein